MTDFEMTEEEFLECEQAERQKHDDMVRELENMEVDIAVDDEDCPLCKQGKIIKKPYTKGAGYFYQCTYCGAVK